MRFDRTQPLAIGFLVFGGLGPALTGLPAVAAPATEELVYVGTQGAAPPTNPPSPPGPLDKATQGIYQMRLDLKTGALSIPTVAFELQHATALMTHPQLPIVYSVAEGSNAQANSDLYAFKVDKQNERLDALNKVDSGGRDTTALDLDERSATVFAAHYGSGGVSAVPIKDDGSLAAVASSQTETGSGPNPWQKSAHAHGVAVSPDHNHALVADFGADRIFIYRFDATTRTLSPGKVVGVTLPAGSGPRHIVFHPSGKYVFVNTELTAELRSYRWDARAGRLLPGQVVQTYPDGYAGEKSSAELAVSKDGRFVYLSLRKDQNCIVVFSVEPRHGALTEIQRVPAQGDTPWSFGIDPSGHWMLVTNQGSNSVVVLSVDPDSGRLSTTRQSVTIPKPVAVTFYDK